MAALLRRVSARGRCELMRRWDELFVLYAALAVPLVMIWLWNFSPWADAMP